MGQAWGRELSQPILMAMQAGASLIAHKLWWNQLFTLLTALLTNESIRKSLKMISNSCFSNFYVKYGFLKPKLRCAMFFFLFSDDAISSLQIWYYLEIHSAPGPPLNTIEVKCIALVRTPLIVHRLLFANSWGIYCKPKLLSLKNIYIKWAFWDKLFKL